jgi:aryl-alcohol dehydrogenase-like predicted oxidoreductase
VRALARLVDGGGARVDGGGARVDGGGGLGGGGLVDGGGAFDALFDALDDPFWRVRYAAIQALAARPDARAPDRAVSAREAAARAYLEAARRGERAVAAEPPEPAVVFAEDAPASAWLGDPDPAVVAARLAGAPPGAEGGAALVAALGSSHASLRRVAVRLLAARGSEDEIAAALGWLDDPRVLYAADAVGKLLRRVHTLPLVERVIADPAAGKGARAWALAEAARLRVGVPHAVIEAASRDADPSVRRAAMCVAAERGDVAALIQSARDPDESTRAEAVDALGAALDDPDVRAALPGPEDGLFVARALLGAVRVWIGRDGDPRASEWIDGVLRRAAAVPWVDVRAEAIALRARRGLLAEDERAACLGDPDPWIREAAVDAFAGADLLASDPDPFVRRAAARVALASFASRAGSLSPSERVAAATTASLPPDAGALPPPERHAAAKVAARSPDAWIRATAAGAIDARADDGFALLLRLTRDRTPMVRAAAADALDRPGNVHARCLRILQATDAPDDVRLAAHARLVACPGAAGLAALVADLRAAHVSAADREVLRATALAYPEALRAQIRELRDEPSGAPPRVATRPRAAPPPPRVAMRTLGKTGIAVAPLGISGAGEMPVPCFEAAREAGANLFFWEPSHRALSTFVARAPRRHELVLVTGSYEADARSIERDVERALRRLRVEALGAMLLFWVRSGARLVEGAWEALDRLKQQGKVRAVGFSTHRRDLAKEAIASQAWDVVMCRLSAAHPGAERELLPAALAQGTGVIAFSALCYGRLIAAPLGAGSLGASLDASLDVPLDAPPITAADCYRYALSQPGVSVCLSAPRRWRELSENLGVLQQPALDEPTIERLRAHGERVRADNKSFEALVHRA